MAKGKRPVPSRSEDEESYGELEDLSEGSMLEEEEEEADSDLDLAAAASTGGLREANKANLLNY